jgi:hypothetical protein
LTKAAVRGVFAAAIVEVDEMRRPEDLPRPRIKHWLGIAARCDEYALTCLRGVVPAAMAIHHRNPFVGRGLGATSRRTAPSV